MDTFKRTPMQLFNLPQHFVIPLFQRPYVWKEEEQWEPLWQDIRRVAEVRVKEPQLRPQHFLGAVVLQAHDAGSNRVTTWNVIDGQQRITTLQLLMDATAAVLAAAGCTRQASQLESLTHNSANYISDGESLLKVRHLNSDREAFGEVMDAEPPVEYAGLRHHGSRMADAHQYFTLAVEQWLGDPDSAEYLPKAEALATVLQDDLQLVTIELLSSENSQEIFETLNARGTPLTAADLVRNFVFQRLQSEGGDTERAYKEDWPFETKFWAREVSVGRYFITRSSLFLNQWLMSRAGEEISPQATFTRFKAYVEHDASQKMADLLPVLKAQAEQYEQWTTTALRPGGDLSRVELNVYRMQVSGVELLKPLLLWLHEPGRDLPQNTIDRIVAAAESWVVRRQLLRMSTSGLGSVVAEMVSTDRTLAAEDLADRIIGYLSRLNVTSTYWPGDEEVRTALKTESVYRRFPRARLRSYLEAIEDSFRAETGQPQVERAGFPIEHILPQKWQDNWPVQSEDDGFVRQEHVNRLGNLTLLTNSLNSKVSNGPWSTKRAALLEHNTIKLTGRLIEQTQEHPWDEELIDGRTDTLIDAMLQVWSVPAGHSGKVADPQTKAQDWVQLKHLVEAGLLTSGQAIVARPGDFGGVTAEIGDDARIHINHRAFDTPSGAGRHVRGKNTNGWQFWGLTDGRRLADLRAEFLNPRRATSDADPS